MTLALQRLLKKYEYLPMAFLNFISMIEKTEHNFSVFNSGNHDEKCRISDN